MHQHTVMYYQLLATIIIMMISIMVDNIILHSVNFVPSFL